METPHHWKIKQQKALDEKKLSLLSAKPPDEKAKKVLIDIQKFIKNPNRLIKKSKNGQLDLERFSQKISAEKYENIFYKL